MSPAQSGMPTYTHTQALRGAQPSRAVAKAGTPEITHVSNEDICH